MVDYLAYKKKVTNTAGNMPSFDVEPEIALEVLQAASYLGIE